MNTARPALPRGVSAAGAKSGERHRNRRVVPRPATHEHAAPQAARRSFRDRFAALRERIAALGARLRVPLVIVGRTLVVGAAIAGAVALFRIVERHVRTSPAFATREIEVRGAVRLDRDEVADIAGIALGQNVFEVSPEQARRRLLEEPWIAEADVRRRLPGRWTITVRERVAVALLALPDVWLVSDEGTVFKRAEPGDPMDLPVITGIDRDRFLAERAYRTRMLLGIVALLEDWRASGLERREPVAEIHVEPDEGLTLRVGDDGAEIRLGAGPHRAKLDRLRRVLDELAARQARPAYVNLDHVRRPERVVVRVR